VVVVLGELEEQDRKRLKGLVRAKIEGHEYCAEVWDFFL
jgi:hypothetical protein